MLSSPRDLADSSTVDLVEGLAGIAAELATREADESGTSCKELAEILAGAVDQTEHALAGLIARVDISGVVKDWGFASTKAWLRTTLGMRDGRAQERLRLARQLPRLTQVDKRWAAGDLSYGYAATIAEAVHRLSDEDCAKAEDILLGLADEGVSPVKVARLGHRIRDVIAERDGVDLPEETKREYERSWMVATRSLDGGSYVKGWLNPEDSAIWHGTLDPLAEPAGPDDLRDTAERTAAVLSSVLSGGHKATKVTVIVDLEALTEDPGAQTGRADVKTSARLPDGTPLPAEQARRIALSARVSPLILGAGNVPLYFGHATRFASQGQRQVLETLYSTCAVEHCPIPGTLCEVDHVDGWALGNSPTDIDKLALCCGWHNRWKHAHPDQVEITHNTQGQYVYRTLPPPLPWKTGRQRRVQTANHLEWISTERAPKVA
ncbi:DUF222 domain-containing protein [Actinomadura sp. 6N118]|uniref:HNH endonuclease signature motif containing protein n=1 Tax=Actinomadura sp. 6N118 TaxID=3375151 RepID=UPI0037958CA6